MVQLGAAFLRLLGTAPVYVMGLLSFISVIVILLQALAGFVFFREQRHSGGGALNSRRPNLENRAGLVSILKPISGIEDGLEENLRSFAELRGVDYEFIMSIADPDDPAIPIAREAAKWFPAGRARLVVGGAPRMPNPKIERLVAAARVSGGDILFISDSNVRVSNGDIQETVASFCDPAIGCVSNPFTGEQAHSIGSLLECLYLIVFVTAGSTMARFADKTCVIGKSMALSRKALDAIGGFESFSSYLAEDQSIGLAVRRAGFKVEMSRVVVRNIIRRRSLRAALKRQVRWAKIRYSFSKVLFTCEFLMNPLPLALATSGLAWVILPHSIGLAVVWSLLVVAARMMQAGLLLRATRSRIHPAALLLLPVQDVLQFACQLVPYASNEVDWRGFTAKLGRDTLILNANIGGDRLPASR